MRLGCGGSDCCLRGEAQGAWQRLLARQSRRSGSSMGASAQAVALLGHETRRLTSWPCALIVERFAGRRACSRPCSSKCSWSSFRRGSRSWSWSPSPPCIIMLYSLRALAQPSALPCPLLYAPRPHCSASVDSGDCSDFWQLFEETTPALPLRRWQRSRCWPHRLVESSPN